MGPQQDRCYVFHYDHWGTQDSPPRPSHDPPIKLAGGASPALQSDLEGRLGISLGYGMRCGPLFRVSRNTCGAMRGWFGLGAADCEEHVWGCWRAHGPQRLVQEGRGAVGRYWGLSAAFACNRLGCCSSPFGAQSGWFPGPRCPPDTAQSKTNIHLTGGSAQPRPGKGTL